MAKKAKYGFDRILLGAVLFLVVFGYIMVISAHSVVYTDYGTFAFVREIGKTTLFIFAGFFLMFLMIRKFKIEKFVKHIKLFSAVIVIAMLATLLWPEQNGAKAWIRLPGMTIQPVEFLKLFMILFFAYYFGTYYNVKAKASKILTLPIVLVIGIAGFIFLIQNDLGSALIFLMIVLCIFFALPEKKYRKYKVILFVLIVAFVLLFYVFGPMLSSFIFDLPAGTKFKAQLLRIAILFDPIKDVYDSGYQLVNSLSAMSGSGLFGVGLGNSETKLIVPEPYNDAIISVIGEELGVFGILCVFVPYFVIITRLLAYASKKNIFISDRIILVGIASFFMAQLFVNVGGMVGMIPMTGVTLMFISSGGTSIIAAFLSIGVAQGVIKRYLK